MCNDDGRLQPIIRIVNMSELDKRIIPLTRLSTLDAQRPIVREWTEHGPSRLQSAFGGAVRDRREEAQNGHSREINENCLTAGKEMESCHDVEM